MRPLRPIIIALAALAGAALFVPALSPAAPIVSTADDFELPAPKMTARTSSTHGTTIVRVARRFTTFGFRWHGSSTPQIEVQSYGKNGWSPWTKVPAGSDHGPDAGLLLLGPIAVPSTARESTRATKGGSSDPVFTGPSSALRYRIDPRPPGLKLHFVNVVAQPGAHMSARTSAGAPQIVPRSQWAGSKCPPRDEPSYGEVLGAFVHHTVSTNLYTASQAPGVVLGICRFHRNSNGWDDIGYNLLVDRFGNVYEGRDGGVDKAVIGAQAQGYNGQSTGIATIGTYSSAQPSSALLSSLKTTLEWKLGLHGVTRNEPVSYISAGGAVNRYPANQFVELSPIAGHRDGDATECPGGALYAKLPSLREFLTSSQRNATRVSLVVRPKSSVTASGTIVVRGLLRDVSGSRNVGVADAVVIIEAYRNNGWEEIATARTDATGRWSTTLRPGKNSTLRVWFKGNSDLRPVGSLERFVKVRPDLKLKLRKRAPNGTGGAMVVRATVEPVKQSVSVSVRRVDYGQTGPAKRVKVKPVRDLAGAFDASFRPAVSGLYRFTAWFAGDLLHTAGGSEPLEVKYRR